jgi:DNA-directed RNA polymerase specialized sigma24 family protein
MTPALNDSHVADLQRVIMVPDPVERARVAGALLEQCAQAVEVLAKIRREALVQMHQGGMSRQDIADAIGVSKPRVSQLIGVGWTYTPVAPAARAGVREG